MAQYYQVTSLEELHHLYPNLQLENVEGIPCMIQDEQYTDVQGQQIVTAVDQTNIQLAQNAITSSQCKPQQSQYVVQHPTQYVIQQIDANEPQTDTLQYIQQRQETSNQVESDAQLPNQAIGCVGSNISHTLESESNKQYVTQVQPIVQQPIQINQPIQAVDMGGNILFLQNQEQEILVGNERVEAVMNQQENQHHIFIQRHQQQQQQQQKQLQIDSHIQQLFQRNDNSNQHFLQQNLQNCQGGKQQPQQALNHSDQTVVQPLQYYNQVTVIDGFSQPNVTVEPVVSSVTTNLGVQPQITTQVQQQEGHQQQFKSIRVLPQTGAAVFQSSPSPRIEVATSTPVNVRLPQCKKKVQLQEAEITSPPVYIVQKLDSPLVIRQPQTKLRFQSPNVDKACENSFQTVTKPCEKVSRGIVTQVFSQDSTPGKSQVVQVTTADKVISTVPSNQGIKSPKSGGQVKVEITEQQSPVISRSADNKSTNVSSATPVRTATTTALTTATATTPTARIKTVEQQTESVILSNGKEIAASQVVSNAQCQTSPSTQSHVLLQIQSASPTLVNRGRGLRGSIQISGVRQQFSPRGRGVQVQTSPPRSFGGEGNVIIRGAKIPVRGSVRGGRGGWSASPSNQRQVATRPETSQTVQTVTLNDSTAKENIEETKVLVLLLNGEKKLIRIPSSQQSIFLGQILQQAGLTVSAPTSIAVEQVVDISNRDQNVSKSTNQQTISNKAGQLVSTSAQVEGTTNIITAIQPQQQRGQSPRLQVTIPRHQLELSASKLATSTSVQTIGSGSTFEIVNVQTQTQQSLGTHNLKEEPRFVSGYMAICPYCGIQSLDFNKCIRCRRKLPENVKAKPIFNDIRLKSEKATENEKGSEAGDNKQADSCSNDSREKTLLQITDRKKIRPCVKKKKISDEPTEILILSSDDEEDNKLKKTELPRQSLCILRKEPVYLPFEIPEKDMNVMIKEVSLNEELMKNAEPGSFTTFPCRTIRVGSHKVQPKERVLVSNKGVRFVINSLKNENTVIVIPFSDIIKVLVHYGKQMPVIFIYPQPKTGVQIRHILGMDNKLGIYYDPASSNETHKRIILLLEKLSEDNKIILNKLFNDDKLEELSEKEANEILMRASPPEVHGISFCRPTDAIRKILVYPPPPEKGGITLNNQDYACLGEDQFLNDVIIDFYLKYLMLRILSPEDRNRTHVFSTFFYKRLTTKPKTLRKNDPENDPKLTPAEKRHMRVKGWTKQVNLFEKDFIIVPINEHSHWFLAIICFPGLTGPVRYSDNTPVEPEEVSLRKNSETIQIGNTTITHIIKSDGNTINLELDCGSDRDEAEGDQDDLHPSSDDEEAEPTEEEERSTNATQVQIPLLAPVAPAVQSNNKDVKSKPVKKKMFKEPIKQPCILIFDSLAGASRVRVVATLRDYLKIEYKTKMGQDKDFSKDTIKGAVPKVPQQNNFTDCGLYVLQYVESFFQEPLHDFKLPLKYLQEWFPEEVVSCKRQKLALLIRSLMEEQGINADEMGLPVLTFTNGNMSEENHVAMDEEEDEEEYEEMNEDDEEMMKHQVQTAEYDNEDEEMEMADDDDDDDEDEDYIDEDDEELEEGEIPRQWLTQAQTPPNELDASVEKGERRVVKAHSLVNYDESESEEEEFEVSHSNNSKRLQSSSEGNEGELCESEQTVITSAPEIEEDVESQIICTTIDKKKQDCIQDKNVDVLASDGEESGLAPDEEETSFESSSGDHNFVTVGTESKKTASSSEREKSNSLVFKDSKTRTEVTDIIKKLVCDKNITISRKEESSGTNSLKKQYELGRSKSKDCDTTGSDEKTKTMVADSILTGLKNSLTTQKRTFQALKSVRIPKKAERVFEGSDSKRQKVDET